MHFRTTKFFLVEKSLIHMINIYLALITAQMDNKDRTISSYSLKAS